MANEKRLIDANGLKRNVWLDGTVVVIAVAEVDEAPTVDAVEVVRCKDCKFFTEREEYNDGNCSEHYMSVYSDDFCSYGERKDNG